MTPVAVKNVAMRAAGPADQATGVIGFVQATINGLVIDDMTVRRSLANKLWIGFPQHADAYGRVFPTVRPEDDAMRREVTRQLLAALGLTGAVGTPPTAQGESGTGAAP